MENNNSKDNDKERLYTIKISSEEIVVTPEI